MKTNSITHTIDINNKTVNCVVKIRLNDEYKNGHQDFSITGVFWEIDKTRIDKYIITAGACHDTILKYFPELKPFVDLHLCDAFGAPMYAAENGFYHLRNGFNRKEGDIKATFCEYYRVTPEQFDELNKSESVLQYAVRLKNLGILEKWKNDANKAIKLLEELTGDEFINDSKKGHYNEPASEEIIKFNEP